MKRKTSRIPLISINTDRLRYSIPITLILFLAATLYFYQLGTESLWYDEIMSIQAAQAKIFSLSLNRPLYFMLLHFWMRFGSNEAWLRGLSVIFGLGSVFLTYLLGCRLANKLIGLIAAFLLTLSPLVINHSQEVRMYMLSMFLGLGGSLIMTFLLERPKISFYFWWLSLRILAVLTTPINILLLLPDTLILGWQFRKQAKHIFKHILMTLRKRFWLFGILIITTVMIIKDVVPPLLDFLGERALLSDRKIGIPAFFGSIARLTIGRLKPPLEQLTWLYEHIFFNLFVLVLIVLLGVAWLNWKNSIGLWRATAWGFCPLIMIFLLSQISAPVFGVDRYLLFTAPYIFIVLATGLIQVWHWKKTAALVIIVIYTIAVSISLFRYYSLPYRDDWRGIAQTITVNEQPNDAIALLPEHYLPALTYYHQGGAPIYALGGLPKEKIYPIDKLSLEKMLDEKMLDGLRKFPSRLWLVVGWPSAIDKNHIISSVLEERFELESFQKFTGIDLYLVKANSNN